jgi:hypothetical protein
MARGPAKRQPFAPCGRNPGIQCHHSGQPGFRGDTRPHKRKGLARLLGICFENAIAMIGWRQCAECKKELPEA